MTRKGTDDWGPPTYRVGSKHGECEGTVRRRTMPQFRDDAFIGIDGVWLMESVEEEYCDHCNESLAKAFPNLDGLNAAIVVTRATSPAKLRPRDIRYLRMALGKTQDELADVLDVTNSQVSRWENGKAPIAPNNEKILRVLACDDLSELVPLIEWHPGQIVSMKINPMSSDGEAPAMCFKLVKVAKKAGGISWEAQNAA